MRDFDPSEMSIGKRGAHDATNAERPFPSEAEWLSLPMPPELPNEFRAAPAAFVERVLDALREERALDAAIADEDRKLSRMLLPTHEAPAPTPDFVARTVAAVREDRRARWQQLLARHVAPEPTPQFVARTLAALALERPHAAPRRRPSLRLVTTALLAAAAAVLFVLFGLTRPTVEPFELRIARTTSPAHAHAFAASPLAAVLHEQSRAADGDALLPASADGTWLLFGATR
jgi:hypothetical protein